MSENNTLLQPGVLIKPEVRQNDVKEILREIYGLRCVSIKELNGYDDNNYHVKVEDVSENKNIANVNNDGYVLKVVNSLDSLNPQFFEAQNELLLHLGKNRICCPKPIQNKNGQYYIIHTFPSGKHIVRLLEFISGSIIHQVPSSMHLFYQTGKYVAQLDEVMKNFHHPAYDTLKSVWHMESVPQLSQFLYVIRDESKRKIVEEVIEEFSTKVLPISSSLEKGMIHGDFNEQNILVEQKAGEWFVKGIIDFGDSNYACYVYELAVTMTYMMIQGRSVDVGGHVLAGYTSVRKLTPQEYKVLKVCIAARMCQSLVMGAYSSLQDPENSYILVTAKSGWALLEELWLQPEDKLLERWRKLVEDN
jgi:hydroxylysine kinase